MARIVVVSAAYYGDVMPVVPVAEELVSRGHDVVCVVPSGFHEVLAGHRFALADYGVDFSPRTLAEHGDLWEGPELLAARRLMRLWVGELSARPRREIHAAVDAAAEGADLLLVHNTAAGLVSNVAELRGIPWVVFHLFPMMIASEDSPPPMLPGMHGGGTLGRAVRRAAWRYGMRPFRRDMSDHVFREFRRELGLPDRVDNIAWGWMDADRILVLSPEGYHPRRRDWPDSVVHTGFTVWEGPPGAELPDDLRRYLDAGPPPVLVTFGTSAATNARDGFRLVAEAIERAGERPLLLVGNERNRADLSADAPVWSFAPLTQVLPRVRAVVHQGGHGTSVATLLAGRAAVAMPQGFDQVWHAERLAELGVAAVVPWRRRSVERVREALERMLEPEVEDQVARVADELGAIDGPTAAADEIEVVLEDRRPLTAAG